ncbi:unnamed protein product [Spirodela intermedia]|uniref:Disease resistance N-terminal domain-containing protein n=1 Tax=Spirodela intermedia TaxID=51605 RepID=A0ABN7EDL8_SPIIN|nr:unnamed protein product [Spirodela intermedia]
MNQIKSEFEVIQAFLSHIGTRKENDRLLEAWVKQVREVAFAVEDTMDQYIYLLAERHRRRAGASRRRSSAGLLSPGAGTASPTSWRRS